MKKRLVVLACLGCASQIFGMHIEGRLDGSHLGDGTNLPRVDQSVNETREQRLERERQNQQKNGSTATDHAASSARVPVKPAGGSGISADGPGSPLTAQVVDPGFADVDSETATDIERIKEINQEDKKLTRFGRPMQEREHNDLKDNELIENFNKENFSHIKDAIDKVAELKKTYNKEGHVSTKVVQEVKEDLGVVLDMLKDSKELLFVYSEVTPLVNEKINLIVEQVEEVAKQLHNGESTKFLGRRSGSNRKKITTAVELLRDLRNEMELIRVELNRQYREDKDEEERNKTEAWVRKFKVWAENKYFKEIPFFDRSEIKTLDSFIDDPHVSPLDKEALTVIRQAMIDRTRNYNRAIHDRKMATDEAYRKNYESAQRWNKIIDEELNP